MVDYANATAHLAADVGGATWEGPPCLPIPLVQYRDFWPIRAPESDAAAAVLAVVLFRCALAGKEGWTPIDFDDLAALAPRARIKETRQLLVDAGVIEWNRSYASRLGLGTNYRLRPAFVIEGPRLQPYLPLTTALRKRLEAACNDVAARAPRDFVELVLQFEAELGADRQLAGLLASRAESSVTWRTWLPTDRRRRLLSAGGA